MSVHEVGTQPHRLNIALTPGEYFVLGLRSVEPTVWPNTTTARLEFGPGIDPWVGAIDPARANIILISASPTQVDALIAAGAGAVRAVLDGRRWASGCIRVNRDEIDSMVA